ncbi:MAG: phosphomannomutase [Rhodobacteraceae bacterium]|nr:phosphomannomutase [Paracoccaceae bacterium]
MRVLSCFKAYDIRGQLGPELNTDIAYDIGAAFATFAKLKTAVIGADCRATSDELKAALINGMLDMGVDVTDIGQCGTEEIYHAVDFLKMDCGVEITASHNPINYNGMKLVGKGARPLDPDTEFARIRKLAEAADFDFPAEKGTLVRRDLRADYVKKVLSFITPAKMAPLKILVNAGNGTAGPAFDKIAQQLLAAGAPIEFIRMDHSPDASFPNGIPNPLLIKNQPRTANAVRQHSADFGVAWDGDFDRCFFFDHSGGFIDGYYIVGLLAQQALASNPGAAIIHDPRMIWNTKDIVETLGGTAIQAKTGHAFLKAAMRENNAIYGGEMSAHHYFKDFMYCDSGMIPWLLIAELVSTSGQSLADLVKDRVEKFPSSGEFNFTIQDPKSAIQVVENTLQSKGVTISYADGLSMDFGIWRLNLRSSSTEPLVRLNIESRGDKALVLEKLALVRGMLESHS